MPNCLPGDPTSLPRSRRVVHFLAATGALKQERPDIKGAFLVETVYSKVGCVACHGPRDRLGAPKNRRSRTCRSRWAI